MGLRSILMRQRTPRPKWVFGLFAAGAVLALGIGTTDRVGMTMLLVPMLVCATSYGSYLCDPEGSRESYKRGALVGGLSGMIWLLRILWTAPHAEPGGQLPALPLRIIGFGIGFVLLTLFFASVGGVVGVIGGRAMRATASFTRALVANGKVKPRFTGGNSTRRLLE
jgi:hypothetical protein